MNTAVNRTFGKRVIESAFSLFVVVFMSTGCFAAEKVRALIPVRTIDESIAPFAVAKFLGYYEQEGLDVELIPVGGSNEVAIQVGAGNAQLGEATPAQAVVGMQEGTSAPLDVRYFYDAGYRNIWSISVPSESPVKSIEDLRGKKIGVTALGSAGTTYGKAYIRSGGLNPDTDVTFVAIGAGAQAAAAINQKLVDAIVFWDAANVRFELSGIALRALKIDDNLQKLPDVSLLARNEIIQNKPKMLIGFARAVAKALDFTLTNPAAAVLMTWKLYPEGKPKESDPEKALAQGLKISQLRMAGWTNPATNGKHGLFIQEDWENLSNFLLREKQIEKSVPPSRMYTNAFIDEINQYDRAAVIQKAREFDLSTVR
jgi:NitT/TauT family transport system substrate-binding protein